VQSFDRALCGVLVELYAEFRQSSVQSFEGASQSLSGRAPGRTFGRAPCRASSKALVAREINYGVWL